MKKIQDIDDMSAVELAPVLIAAIERLGELGREAGVELSKLVGDFNTNFEEGAQWIYDISEGNGPAD